MKRSYLLLLCLSVGASTLFGQIISSTELTSFSKTFIGTKYKYGRSSPRFGFDCSGFIFYVFNYFHLPVPRTSLGFSNSGKPIHPDSCKPGDIIVFRGTDPKIKTAQHVGIVLSGKGDQIKFIHSSSSAKRSGVKISTFEESPAYKKRFIKIVRVADLK